MLTYTPLLAIHCTDECFNYKLTHFEPRLFIATIRSHDWNILFILGGADQPADYVQAEILKTKILCLAVGLDRQSSAQQMMTLASEWCVCVCVCDRVWEGEMFSGGLLLHPSE